MIIRGRKDHVAPAYLGLRPAAPDSDLGYHSAALWAGKPETQNARKKTTNRLLVEQAVGPPATSELPLGRRWAAPDDR